MNKTRNYRTWRNNKNGNEKSFACVSYKSQLHLTSECIALSNVALNGIRELVSNVMLLCNTCVDNKEHDSLIRGKNVANKEKVNIGEKFQKVDAKMTKLVDKKVIQALKMTPDKVEITYSSVLDAKAQKGSGRVQPLKHQNYEPKFDYNISQSFTMQGVAEDRK